MPPPEAKNEILTSKIALDHWYARGPVAVLGLLSSVRSHLLKPANHNEPMVDRVLDNREQAATHDALPARGQQRFQLPRQWIQSHTRPASRTHARPGDVSRRHQRPLPTQARRRYIRFRRLVQTRKRLRSLHVRTQQLIQLRSRAARLWQSQRRRTPVARDV